MRGRRNMKKVIGAIVIVALGALLVFGALYSTGKINIGKNTDKTGTNSDKEDEELGEKITIDDYQLKDLVVLGKYDDLKVDVTYEEITEDTMAKYIDQLLVQYPGYNKITKAKVEDKDTVNIDFEGSIDGEVFENGSAKDFNLTIGSNSFIEGFETQLLDQKVGDSVAVKTTFPKDYKEPTLAGKEAVFEVKINSIMEKITYTSAQLDDAFVLANFGFNTVAEFKDDVKKYLTENNETNKTSNTRAAVVAKIIKDSAITLPKELLNSQVAHYMSEFKKSVDGAGYKYDDYLAAQYQMDATAYAKVIKESMTQKLKEQIVLSAIAKDTNTEIDQEGYDVYVKQFLDAYEYVSVEQLYTAYPKKEMERAYLCNKMVEFLIDESTINYVPGKNE